jgi:hypothetical protein
MPRQILFCWLIVITILFPTCTRWDFERVEFLQVVTLGVLEVQTNFAILLGDISNQKTATIVESGFVISSVNANDNNLRLGQVNTISISAQAQDSLASNQAFAVNANNLSAATNYYFGLMQELKSRKRLFMGRSTSLLRLSLG